ncbi:MAG: hypothetical protein V1652_01965 [bacterium]
MSEEQVIKELQKLHDIQPSSEYVRISRMALLIYPKKEVLNRRFFGTVLTQSMQLGISIGIVALFLILVLSNTVSIFHPLSAPNLSGIDTKMLNSESEGINQSINIYIEEAAYFDNVAEKTSVALNEAAINGPDHTNPLLIEKEMQNVINTNQSTGSNPSVDSLLDEVIL